MFHVGKCHTAKMACAVGMFFLLILLTRQPGPATGAEPNRAASRIVDPTHLLAVERRTLPPRIVAGPWNHDTLPAYYWAANSQLASRFAEARSKYDRDQTRRHRSMTLVAGVAGLGKTFIKGKVFDKSYPKSDVCKFDIRELYEAWQDEGKTQLKPDLFCENVILNSLLSVKHKKQDLLYDYLVKQDAKFYAIDSLDEIHPDDYVWVLKQVEKFTFQSGREFIHVAVFGRPLAFSEFWRLRRIREEGRDLRLYILNPPQMRTTGDLQVSSWNYHVWRYKLCWSRPGERGSSGMPLDAYAEWTRLGFDRSGLFRTVSCEPNECMNAEVHGALTKWACEQPIVASMLQNLAGNAIVREIVNGHVERNRGYDERAVMNAYFAAWLVRDTKAGNRPSRRKPEHLELYLRLLESVAVKYLQENKVDERGFFQIQTDDVVKIPRLGRTYTFPVRRILNRSGLVFTDPRPLKGAIYRFEPVWLHRLLVERHNERQAKLLAVQASRAQELPE